MLAALLPACGTVDKVLPDRSADYKKSDSIPELEVPPDLTKSNIDDMMVVPEINPEPTATYSDYSGERAVGSPAVRQAVLPDQSNMRIERDGDKRWLVVSGEAELVWEKAREFWMESGFLIKREDPAIGVMETDWAENRADIPDGPIRSVIGKVFDGGYSSATRDKFRVRLERGMRPNTTELYLTHRGVEETAKGDQFVWQPRPADPELEAEMLRRLMVHFGVEEQQARKQIGSAAADRAARAELVEEQNGVAVLRLKDEFSRAWRTTGVALDRVGFTVEDRNRADGIYFVRYNDPLREQKEKGWFSGLTFWRDDELHEGRYQISLKGEGDETRVTVENEQGESEVSKTALRILTLLEKQLR
ncbi:outer membrane protein assembly factor BamC [Candidatus Reidiella endopervernicosa]|nr:outer membrane protein assembly factor BamC [Candidatus Reidiella endopervernicosa]